MLAQRGLGERLFGLLEEQLDANGLLVRRGSLIDATLVKAQPQVAYKVQKDIEFPWPVAQGILQHHERLDSSGYLSGLTDGDIIWEARIQVVADVVEARGKRLADDPILPQE